MLFLVILAYFIIALIEMPPLYEKKQKSEFLAFIVLLSFVLILSLLINFGVKLPSASKVIEKIVKYILGK